MTTRTFPGVVTAIRDGDSMRVLTDLGFFLSLDVHVRLAQCNARELGEPGGEEARDHLMGLVPVGSPVTLTCFGYDEYGPRWKCLVATADGVDLTRQMVADGYAAKWDGKGSKPVPDWPVPSAA